MMHQRHARLILALLSLFCLCLWHNVQGRSLELDTTFHRYIVKFKPGVPQNIIDLIAVGFNTTSNVAFNYTNVPDNALWRNPLSDEILPLLTYNRISQNYTLPFFSGWAIDVPVADIATNAVFQGLIDATKSARDATGKRAYVKHADRWDNVRVAENPGPNDAPDVLWTPPGVPQPAKPNKRELALFASILEKNDPQGAMSSLLSKSSAYLDLVELSQACEMSILQTGAPWGLNRICQRDRLLDGNYYYNAAAGQDVDCYVIDSGIQSNHVEFESRATGFADFTADGFLDVLGHGSHVAGIIAAKTYGVAKKANLISAKVIFDNGITDYATLIAALNWAYGQIVASGRKSLINLSLSGPISEACNVVVDGMVASGMPVIAAAGNNDGNACVYSPGSAASALAVGAMDSDDYLLTGPPSNTGSCIDMFAPGGSILSTFSGSSTALAFMSGTSMAAPHVVGALAITWSAMPSLTSAALISRLISRVSVDYIFNIPVGTANKLLYGARYV